MKKMKKKDCDELKDTLRYNSNKNTKKGGI